MAGSGLQPVSGRDHEYMVPEIAPEVVENMRSWDGHRRAADPSRPRLRLGARCVPVGGLWQARSRERATRSGSSGSFGPRARASPIWTARSIHRTRSSGADLHRHRPVPGELLIIPTRIGTHAMRTSCGVEAYSTSIHVHVALRQASIWLPASRNGRRCVC